MAAPKKKPERKKRGNYEKPVSISGSLDEILKLSFAPDKPKKTVRSKKVKK